MSFEGFRSRALSLGGGRWVIGFGHTKGAREGVVVTRTEAVAILQNYDLPPIEQFIEEAVMAPLNQNEFDALVSLVFNIGAEAFRTSDVLAFLNSGEKLAAGEAFTAWRKARLNGRLIIVDALIRRRAVEKALFMRHPGCTPIAPSAHIRPVLDEAAARFIPSEPPIVATRERTPEAEQAVPVAEDISAAPQATQTEEVGQAESPEPTEDDGQTELEFDDRAERFVVPESGVHDLPPLVDVEEDDAPIGPEMPAREAPSDKTAPELAAGALVARLTRILGEPGLGADETAAPKSGGAEDGPTPDEITRAISELADGPAAAPTAIADDLPPLPEAMLVEEDALTIEDVAALEDTARPMIDDLEPIPDAALHQPVAKVGANIKDADEPRPRMGLSWLIYVAIGLIGALFALFGIIGPSTDLSGVNRGMGQYGYMGLTVLGGVLVLLSMYFLFKAYRSRS